MEELERVVAVLVEGAERQLDGPSGVNAAFLVALAGGEPDDRAAGARQAAAPEAAAFYDRALAAVREEVVRATAEDRAVGVALAGTAQSVAEGMPARPEALWPLLFPEGVGMLGREEARINELRDRRTVAIEALSDQPIADPSRELLLTSNVLLTVPAAGTNAAALPYPAPLRDAVVAAAGEGQQYWYDHPIQIGVEPSANELLYGLRELDRAIGWERARDQSLGRLRVVLSASVTHAGLRALARDYVRHELRAGGRLEHLEVHLFTEDDARDLLAAVFAGDDGLADVFGVDGEYGRHYSFLKAISALWHVAVDPAIRATFKIDLDQVFSQPELVAQTGRSALDHLRSPLWGARGRGADGRPLELGMIAGALVNERDFAAGLFTPDVALPGPPATADEMVFYSRLPQAISTRAEMMELYDGPRRDGRRQCLERIHVTGGTNGILVDALRRHRPFTPSFIGRAEDQAYILSALDGPADGPADAQPAAADGPPRLAYAHQAGLIMRHDKEAFAGQAIEAARVGKLVGDDVRILYFSAYADALGRERVKALIDPFTGCFASRLPATVVSLRLALRIKSAAEAGRLADAAELLEIGSRRLGQALEISHDRAGFAAALRRERDAWARYYDGLDRLERGLTGGEGWALAAGRRVREVVGRTLLA